LLEMPRGTTLYHGTKHGGFDVPRGPAWFTDVRSTAKEFLELWRSSRPSPRTGTAGKPRGARLEKGSRILRFRTIHDLRLLDISEPQGIPAHILRHYLGPKMPERGGISTYELADAICDEGIYDGWVCDVGCLWKEAEGADILLCRPGRSLAGE